MPDSRLLQLRTLPSLALRWIDLLLPLSLAAVLFTGRVDALYGALAVAAWLLIGLLARRQNYPWALVLAALVALRLREVVLPPDDVYSNPADMLVLLGAFSVGYGRRVPQWQRAFLLLMGMLLFGLLFVRVEGLKEVHGLWLGFDGINRNRSAFIVGYCGIAAASQAAFATARWLRSLAMVLAVVALALVVGLGSRAGVILPLLSLGLAWVVSVAHVLSRWRRWILACLVLLLALPVAVWMYATGAGISSRNYFSDLGRLRMAGCFLRKASGIEQGLLLGSGDGKDSLATLCAQAPELVSLPTRHHAHNLYVQIIGENGWLAFALVALLLLLIFRQSIMALRDASGRSEQGVAFAGLALASYVLIFGLVDVLPLRMALTQVLYGLALSIPFASLQVCESST